MKNTLKQRIASNELMGTLGRLEGNPKWSILTEPLWYIPFALYSPFATIYMYNLGLSQLEIGITITIGMILQVFFAFISGAVTDKFGRRKTTFIFDVLSWLVPCFIWAFAQNFWWFLAAAMFNALYQITNTSWTCLFIEDCPEEHVVNAFTLIQITGMLSVFFAPIAVWLIGEYSLVPVVRGLYIFSGISMGLKFLILYIYGGETKQGEIRLEETKDVPFVELLKGYKGIMKEMIGNKKIGIVLVFMGIASISSIATGSFFSLYLTETLHLPEEVVAICPMIRTGIMLLFIIGVQKILNQLSLRHSIVVGLGICILSHICLIIAPPQTLAMVILYTVFEAIGYAIFIPRKDALMTLFVDPQERSRIYALLHTVMIGITAPFGWIIGQLSTIDGRYPFLLNILFFGIGIGVIQWSKTVRES